VSDNKGELTYNGLVCQVPFRYPLGSSSNSYVGAARRVVATLGSLRGVAPGVGIVLRRPRNAFGQWRREARRQGMWSSLFGAALKGLTV
jgi:hypothetical protein